MRPFETLPAHFIAQDRLAPINLCAAASMTALGYRQFITLGRNMAPPVPYTLIRSEALVDRRLLEQSATKWWLHGRFLS